MGLVELSQFFLPRIEAELEDVMAQARRTGLDGLYAMMAYHLGWEGEGAGPAARGKRIRPVLVLLTASACGGAWEQALPAAAAVELVHNFSLIHDDIQDQSPLRHGRATVWKLWGAAQAINAGDAMFTLAFMALRRLAETVSPLATLRAADFLQDACLSLTQGQYLDLAYEARGDLAIEAYWPMVTGKTAALLSACTALGALAAGAEEQTLEAYRNFGRLLGVAFQAQDDLLGIWGDAALTGKSAESDLLAGKKSLPVLYGISQDGAFAQRWAQGPVTLPEVAGLAAQLAAEGGLVYTQQQANDLTNQALQALESAQPRGEAGEALIVLTHQLLGRKM